MIDCSNIDVREALPEFLHGTLDTASRERIQAHLDECMDCAAELRVMRVVLVATSSPQVDPVRIAAAIVPYRRRRRIDVAYMRMAAAFLVAAIGVSTIVVTHRHSAEQIPVTSSADAPASPGVAIVGVSELSDDHLEQLISDMDQLEALPPADPEPVVPADPEGGA